MFILVSKRVAKAYRLSTKDVHTKTEEVRQNAWTSADKGEREGFMVCGRPQHGSIQAHFKAVGTRQ